MLAVGDKFPGYKVAACVGSDSDNLTGPSNADYAEKCVLDAIQSDELCPCNWKKGDEHL